MVLGLHGRRNSFYGPLEFSEEPAVSSPRMKCIGQGRLWEGWLLRPQGRGYEQHDPGQHEMELVRATFIFVTSGK